MSNTAAVQFQKRMRRCYGTGVWREAYENAHLCDCAQFEVCIDGNTSNDGWWIREVCECGNFSGWLGEWFRTLDDAKISMAANANRVG